MAADAAVAGDHWPRPRPICRTLLPMKPRFLGSTKGNLTGNTRQPEFGEPCSVPPIERTWLIVRLKLQKRDGDLGPKKCGELTGRTIRSRTCGYVEGNLVFRKNESRISRGGAFHRKPVALARLCLFSSANAAICSRIQRRLCLSSSLKGERSKRRMVLLFLDLNVERMRFTPVSEIGNSGLHRLTVATVPLTATLCFSPFSRASS